MGNATVREASSRIADARFKKAVDSEHALCILSIHRFER